FSYSSRAPPALHSFPTRRSSDLAGFQVVLDLTTKTGATTLASEVQRLQAANPDILFLVQYPPETSIFQGDAKRAGWMPKIIATRDRKSTRLNSSHRTISYAVFCL